MKCMNHDYDCSKNEMLFLNLSFTPYIPPPPLHCYYYDTKKTKLPSIIRLLIIPVLLLISRELQHTDKISHHTNIIIQIEAYQDVRKFLRHNNKLVKRNDTITIFIRLCHDRIGFTCNFSIM